MANNKTLESKNKIVQSLDLYANNILNVSKIVGNKDFTSSRSQDLEISTRDKDTENAGNLLLRAGTSTSGSKGYVHIFAGNTEESETVDTDGIYVHPNGVINTTATNHVTIQSPSAPSAANSIVLTAAENKLEINNTTAISNSENFILTATKTMSIKGQNSNNGIITTPFEINVPANQDLAIITISDLHVNNDIKFGGVTGNTQTGRGTTATHVTVTGKAGNVDIQQVGSFSLTGQNQADNPLGQFSLKNASTQEDTSKTKSLLTIQHEDVTERAYVNNLDVYGDIRLGTLSNVSTGHPAPASEVSTANTSLTAKLANIDLATTTDFAIDATKIQITGNSTANTGATDALQISSQGDGISGSGTYATADRSYIKADVVHAKRDFYGNNVHMYWDADTSSLVFAKII